MTKFVIHVEAIFFILTIVLAINFLLLKNVCEFRIIISKQYSLFSIALAIKALKKKKLTFFLWKDDKKYKKNECASI